MSLQLPKFVHQLNESLLTNYWPDFQMVPYALYTDNDVFLFNHPAFNQSGYDHLPWREEFIGNTLILFENHPTAIVKIDDFSAESTLYSVLIHELFHGLQYIRGESRFPDEILGITYPLQAKNIQLRQQERLYLHKAVLEKNLTQRKNFINKFILFREQRAQIIDKYLAYEELIETIEGPAFYIELNAYTAKSNTSIDENIQSYGKSLLDINDTVQHLRKSCYSSGLFLCLLLDELNPNWQSEFMESSLTLFTYFRQFIKPEKEPLVTLISTHETNNLIAAVQEERENQFTKVCGEAGYILTIRGDIQIIGIDPMNIIANNQKTLHQNFIRIKLALEEYLIQQPVITHFKEHLFHCHTIELLLNEKPIIQSDCVIIQDIGNINGLFDESESILYANKNDE